jgi:hypothetical protein
MYLSRIRKYLSLHDHFLFAGIILCFTLAGIVHSHFEQPRLVITKQESAVNINKNIYRYLNLGNKRLLSDVLWIQTLLESDEEHYSKADLNSWMYHRFLTISLLDPYFYENYLYGGIFLSIVKDDPLGASEILSKGLTYFPDDYRLNYHIAFNYIFELGIDEKGLYHLEKIKNHPHAPKNIKSILEKLRLEISNDFDIALEFLTESYEQTKDVGLKKKIKEEIYAVKAERDLKCLNDGHKTCETRDFENNPYLKDNKGKWQTQRPFKNYRLKRSARFQ